MADADAGAAEPRDLLVVEMDAVREPRALRHPAGLLQEIDRAHARRPPGRSAPRPSVSQRWVCSWQS